MRARPWDRTSPAAILTPPLTGQVTLGQCELSLIIRVANYGTTSPLSGTQSFSFPRSPGTACLSKVTARAGRSVGPTPEAGRTQHFLQCVPSSQERTPVATGVLSSCCGHVTCLRNRAFQNLPEGPCPGVALLSHWSLDGARAVRTRALRTAGQVSRPPGWRFSILCEISLSHCSFEFTTLPPGQGSPAGTLTSHGNALVGAGADWEGTGPHLPGLPGDRWPGRLCREASWEESEGDHCRLRAVRIPVDRQEWRRRDFLEVPDLLYSLLPGEGRQREPVSWRQGRKRPV